MGGLPSSQPCPTSLRACSSCGRCALFDFYSCARGCAASILLIPIPPRSPFPRVVRVAWQDGSTPLHIASSQGHSEVVERLIAAQAMVEATNKVAPRTRHTTLPPTHTLQHRDAGGGSGEYSLSILVKDGAEGAFRTGDQCVEQLRCLPALKTEKTN
jgi:hypothetical protein